MDIDDRSSDCSRCELRYIPFQAVLKYFFSGSFVSCWSNIKLLSKISRPNDRFNFKENYSSISL